MTKNELITLCEKQKNFYKTLKTKDINFRLQQLKKLYKLLYSNKLNIFKCLKEDLGKTYKESYTSELLLCLEEIHYFIKNLKKLSKRRKIENTIKSKNIKSFILYEPLGLTYIISPFNYPLQLTVVPLIDSIASGNVNLIKLSEKTSNFTKYFTNLINENFPEEFLKIIDIDYETSDFLISNFVDHVFFTGSTKVGHHIMEIASNSLCKVSLELGGKSPCVILDDANIEQACKRIIYGKYLNAGQTCIAVDYLYVSENKYKEVLANLEKYIKLFYGENPLKNENYNKIIDASAFNRLKSYLKQGKIYFGGKTDDKTNRIEPTILFDIKRDSKLNEDEIFGPILPIYIYKDYIELIKELDCRIIEKPLAFYIFTNNLKQAKEILNRYSSGTSAINDTIMQIVNNNVPFGGVNYSGINSYHGKFGFECFSHLKSITYNLKK